jgi:putative PIN family toxin of toxin-antitoxin system
MRLILDTNVLVAALRSPNGASANLLVRARRNECVMLASVGLFLEYESVLKRDEQLEASHLSKRQVDQFIDALASFVEPVRIHYHWRPVLKDADENKVLEAAVNGAVDGIVTFNTKDFLTAAPYFDLKTLLPKDALEELVLKIAAITHSGSYTRSRRKQKRSRHQTGHRSISLSSAQFAKKSRRFGLLSILASVLRVQTNMYLTRSWLEKAANLPAKEMSCLKPPCSTAWTTRVGRVLSPAWRFRARRAVALVSDGCVRCPWGRWDN